ncbi:hypothetical protein [Atlantibacter subterraneus]|uniref:hypothetical protein n=1 Tax=Atlantibacter subterraneus TaxID=255519 RepID=UPI0011828F7A|nr:hypothetical protein [Atlantibacter subterranea]TSJ55556.1 hypothetical protein FND52_12835 [Atlantibacter subterranea]
MFRVVILIIFSALFVQPVFADNARPETAKHVKGYIGLEGVKLCTLRIGPRSENEALLQISNIDHELDMKILRCKVQPISDGGKGYSTEIDGKQFMVLRLNNGVGELYLPGETPISVAYNDDLSRQGDAEYFLTDYLERKAKK